MEVLWQIPFCTAGELFRKNVFFLRMTLFSPVTKNISSPKKDLHHGSSCYFLKEGFKVSKFCRENGSLLYWYCDIVDYDFHPYDNHLIVTDLLADVIIYPDGFVKVVDLDELVTALDARSIDINTLKSSLVRLDKLLKIIYSGKFDSLQKYIP